MKCRAATSDFRITFRFIMHHTHITNRVMQQQKFSQQAIIMLYFSVRVCYDLAGIRPVATEHLLKRWKDALPLRYGGL